MIRVLYHSTKKIMNNSNSVCLRFLGARYDCSIMKIVLSVRVRTFAVLFPRNMLLLLRIP